MKQIFFLLVIFLSEKTGLAQTTAIDSNKVKTEQENHDEEIVFTKVESEAQFPGGDSSWFAYLRRSLNPNTPVLNGARAGNYQVIIRFIVSKDGSIRDARAETGYGFGMEAEAIRVITNGPRWIPGSQNGKKVNCYRRQPITFSVVAK